MIRRSASGVGYLVRMGTKALYPVLSICAALGSGGPRRRRLRRRRRRTPAPRRRVAAPTESTGATTRPATTGDERNAPAPSGDAVRSAKVEIVDFAYDPDPVTIEEGGKVIWLNEDSAPHTATAEDGSFDTGTLEEGKLSRRASRSPAPTTVHLLDPPATCMARSKWSKPAGTRRLATTHRTPASLTSPGSAGTFYVRRTGPQR